MKLYVDTNGKQVTVTKDPVAKNDGQTDRQKTERGTGRPDVVDAGVRPGRRRRRGHHRHYGWKSESSAFLKAGSAGVGGGFVELAGAAARLGYVGRVVRVRRGEARRRPRCG